MEISGHNTRMRVRACGDISSPLFQHVLFDFIRGTKRQGLVEGTRFDAMLCFVAVRRSEELNWAVNGFGAGIITSSGPGLFRVCRGSVEKRDSFQSRTLLVQQVSLLGP